MSYKYFGRLVGTTKGAEEILKDSTPPHKRTPFDPQAPGTKFFAFGEAATSRGFNRVAGALATNIDYIANLIDTPSVRADVLKPLSLGASGTALSTNSAGISGFAALHISSFHTNSFGSGASFSNNPLINLGESYDSAQNYNVAPPAAWVYVGNTKGHLSAGNILRLVANPAYSSKNTEKLAYVHPDLPGAYEHLPTDILANKGSSASYFPPSDKMESGVNPAALPDAIGGIGSIRSDIAPYSGGPSDIDLSNWVSDGAIANVSSSWASHYVRPGVYLNVTGTEQGHNDGLYAVRSISGGKVVLTRGNLARVTVANGGLFSVGQLVAWSTSQPQTEVAYDKRDAKAYVMFKSGNTLYLSSASMAEDFGGRESASIEPTVTAHSGDYGLSDQEKDAGDNWGLPDGARLYPISYSNINSTTNSIVSQVIPPGYPVHFKRLKTTFGSATPCNPPGFLLNPCLVLAQQNQAEFADILPAAYRLECRTLTTYRERIAGACLTVRGGETTHSTLGTYEHSGGADMSEDPGTLLPLGKQDMRYQQLKSLAHSLKYGDPGTADSVDDGYLTSRSQSNTGTANTHSIYSLNTDFGRTRNYLGASLIHLTLDTAGDGTGTGMGSLYSGGSLDPHETVNVVHPDFAATGAAPNIDNLSYAQGTVVCGWDNHLILRNVFRVGDWYDYNVDANGVLTGGDTDLNTDFIKPGTVGNPQSGSYVKFGGQTFYVNRVDAFSVELNSNSILSSASHVENTALDLNSAYHRLHSSNPNERGMGYGNKIRLVKDGNGLARPLTLIATEDRLTAFRVTAHSNHPDHVLLEQQVTGVTAENNTAPRMQLYTSTAANANGALNLYAHGAQLRLTGKADWSDNNTFVDIDYGNERLFLHEATDNLNKLGFVGWNEKLGPGHDGNQHKGTLTLGSENFEVAFADPTDVASAGNTYAKKWARLRYGNNLGNQGDIGGSLNQKPVSLASAGAGLNFENLQRYVVKTLTATNMTVGKIPGHESSFPARGVAYIEGTQLTLKITAITESGDDWILYYDSQTGTQPTVNQINNITAASGTYTLAIFYGGLSWAKASTLASANSATLGHHETKYGPESGSLGFWDANIWQAARSDAAVGITGYRPILLSSQLIKTLPRQVRQEVGFEIYSGVPASDNPALQSGISTPHTQPYRLYREVGPGYGSSLLGAIHASIPASPYGSASTTSKHWSMGPLANGIISGGQITWNSLNMIIGPTTYLYMGTAHHEPQTTFDMSDLTSLYWNVGLQTSQSDLEGSPYPIVSSPSRLQAKPAVLCYLPGQKYLSDAEVSVGYATSYMFHTYDGLYGKHSDALISGDIIPIAEVTYVNDQVTRVVPIGKRLGRLDKSLTIYVGTLTSIPNNDNEIYQQWRNELAPSPLAPLPATHASEGVDGPTHAESRKHSDSVAHFATLGEAFAAISRWTGIHHLLSRNAYDDRGKGYPTKERNRAPADLDHKYTVKIIGNTYEYNNPETGVHLPLRIPTSNMVIEGTRQTHSYASAIEQGTDRTASPTYNEPVVMWRDPCALFDFDGQSNVTVRDVTARWIAPPSNHGYVNSSFFPAGSPGDKRTYTKPYFQHPGVLEVFNITKQLHSPISGISAGAVSANTYSGFLFVHLAGRITAWEEELSNTAFLHAAGAFPPLGKNPSGAAVWGPNEETDEAEATYDSWASSMIGANSHNPTIVLAETGIPALDNRRFFFKPLSADIWTGTEWEDKLTTLMIYIPSTEILTERSFNDAKGVAVSNDGKPIVGMFTNTNIGLAKARSLSNRNAVDYPDTQTGLRIQGCSLLAHRGSSDGPDKSFRHAAANYFLMFDDPRMGHISDLVVEDCYAEGLTNTAVTVTSPFIPGIHVAKNGNLRKNDVGGEYIMADSPHAWEKQIHLAGHPVLEQYFSNATIATQTAAAMPALSNVGDMKGQTDWSALNGGDYQFYFGNTRSMRKMPLAQGVGNSMKSVGDLEGAVLDITRNINPHAYEVLSYVAPETYDPMLKNASVVGDEAWSRTLHNYRGLGDLRSWAPLRRFRVNKLLNHNGWTTISSGPLSGKRFMDSMVVEFGLVENRQHLEHDDPTGAVVVADELNHANEPRELISLSPAPSELPTNILLRKKLNHGDVLVRNNRFLAKHNVSRNTDLLEDVGGELTNTLTITTCLGNAPVSGNTWPAYRSFARHREAIKLEFCDNVRVEGNLIADVGFYQGTDNSQYDHSDMNRAGEYDYFMGAIAVSQVEGTADIRNNTIRDTEGLPAIDVRAAVPNTRVVDNLIDSSLSFAYLQEGNTSDANWPTSLDTSKGNSWDFDPGNVWATTERGVGSAFQNNVFVPFGIRFPTAYNHGIHVHFTEHSWGGGKLLRPDIDLKLLTKQNTGVNKQYNVDYGRDFYGIVSGEVDRPNYFERAFENFVTGDLCATTPFTRVRDLGHSMWRMYQDTHTGFGAGETFANPVFAERQAAQITGNVIRNTGHFAIKLGFDDLDADSYVFRTWIYEGLGAAAPNYRMARLRCWAEAGPSVVRENTCVNTGVPFQMEIGEATPRKILHLGEPAQYWAYRDSAELVAQNQEVDAGRDAYGNPTSPEDHPLMTHVKSRGSEAKRLAGLHTNIYVGCGGYTIIPAGAGPNDPYAFTYGGDTGTPSMLDVFGGHHESVYTGGARTIDDALLYVSDHGQPKLKKNDGSTVLVPHFKDYFPHKDPSTGLDPAHGDYNEYYHVRKSANGIPFNVCIDDNNFIETGRILNSRHENFGVLGQDGFGAANDAADSNPAGEGGSAPQTSMPAGDIYAPLLSRSSISGNNLDGGRIILGLNPFKEVACLAYTFCTTTERGRNLTNAAQIPRRVGGAAGDKTTASASAPNEANGLTARYALHHNIFDSQRGLAIIAQAMNSPIARRAEYGLGSAVSLVNIHGNIIVKSKGATTWNPARISADSGGWGQPRRIPIIAAGSISPDFKLADGVARNEHYRTLTTGGGLMGRAFYLSEVDPYGAALEQNTNRNGEWGINNYHGAIFIQGCSAITQQKRKHWSTSSPYLKFGTGADHSWTDVVVAGTNHDKRRSVGQALSVVGPLSISANTAAQVVAGPTIISKSTISSNNIGQLWDTPYAEGTIAVAYGHRVPAQIPVWDSATITGNTFNCVYLSASINSTFTGNTVRGGRNYGAGFTMYPNKVIYERTIASYDTNAGRTINQVPVNWWQFAVCQFGRGHNIAFSHEGLTVTGNSISGYFDHYQRPLTQSMGAAANATNQYLKSWFNDAKDHVRLEFQRGYNAATPDGMGWDLSHDPTGSPESWAISHIGDDPQNQASPAPEQYGARFNSHNYRQGHWSFGFFGANSTVTGNTLPAYKSLFVMATTTVSNNRLGTGHFINLLCGSPEDQNFNTLQDDSLAHGIYSITGATDPAVDKPGSGATPPGDMNLRSGWYFNGLTDVGLVDGDEASGSLTIMYHRDKKDCFGRAAQWIPVPDTLTAGIRQRQELRLTKGNAGDTALWNRHNRQDFGQQGPLYQDGYVYPNTGVAIIVRDLLDHADSLAGNSRSVISGNVFSSTPTQVPWVNNPWTSDISTDQKTQPAYLTHDLLSTEEYDLSVAPSGSGNVMSGAAGAHPTFALSPYEALSNYPALSTETGTSRGFVDAPDLGRYAPNIQLPVFEGRWLNTHADKTHDDYGTYYHGAEYIRLRMYTGKGAMFLRLKGAAITGNTCQNIFGHAHSCTFTGNNVQDDINLLGMSYAYTKALTGPGVHSNGNAFTGNRSRDLWVNGYYNTASANFFWSTSQNRYFGQSPEPGHGTGLSAPEVAEVLSLDGYYMQWPDLGERLLFEEIHLINSNMPTQPTPSTTVGSYQEGVSGWDYTTSFSPIRMLAGDAVPDSGPAHPHTYKNAEVLRLRAQNYSYVSTHLSGAIVHTNTINQVHEDQKLYMAGTEWNLPPARFHTEVVEAVNIAPHRVLGNLLRLGGERMGPDHGSTLGSNGIPHITIDPGCPAYSTPNHGIGPDGYFTKEMTYDPDGDPNTLLEATRVHRTQYGTDPNSALNKFLPYGNYSDLMLNPHKDYADNSKIQKPFALRIKQHTNDFYGIAGAGGANDKDGTGLIIESAKDMSYWKFQIHGKNTEFDPDGLTGDWKAGTRPYSREETASGITVWAMHYATIKAGATGPGWDFQHEDARIDGLSGPAGWYGDDVLPDDEVSDGIWNLEKDYDGGVPVLGLYFRDHWGPDDDSSGDGDRFPEDKYTYDGPSGGTRYDNPTRGGFFAPIGQLDLFDFTGQHKSAPADEALLSIANIGLIVVANGKYKNFKEDFLTYSANINQAIPVVELSSKPKQKSVFGVISSHEEDGPRVVRTGMLNSYLPKEAGDNRLVINSLGEGGIWVCDINGSLENGDYITSCEIPGLGALQDDDLLHNYTVAKITQDCDFVLGNNNGYLCVEFEHEGKTYKRAFVGCTYHCG